MEEEEVMRYTVYMSAEVAKGLLWPDTKLRIGGEENLLHTGAKLRCVGGPVDGLYRWYLWGYHHRGDDVKPFLKYRY